MTVEPGIFPPRFTFSTKILLDHLKTVDLQNKTLLELGCGSGIISLYAASKGARVTASDINVLATESLARNASFNHLDIKILHADLFDDIKVMSFDYIIINPPFYPKDPENVEEMAWFCGAGFDYFHKLFAQIPPYLDSGDSLIILSEDCELERIRMIAAQNGIVLETILEKRKWLETNYVFKLRSGQSQ